MFSGKTAQSKSRCIIRIAIFIRLNMYNNRIWENKSNSRRVTRASYRHLESPTIACTHFYGQSYFPMISSYFASYSGRVTVILPYPVIKKSRVTASYRPFFYKRSYIRYFYRKKRTVTRGNSRLIYYYTW